MLNRLLTLPSDASFFLFGPRAVGKTTLIKSLPWFVDSLYINLLQAKDEMRFSSRPDELADIVNALPSSTQHVIIDEVQKIPKLLDIVHELIETTDKKFILTGSSARKLKRGGANLLAGRAFVYHLHPFTFLEMSEQFHLNDQLRWGTLPKTIEYQTEEKKQDYLMAYANTYLKEEIWAEQFIRELAPFRKFLEVAAQSNGKVINFSNISRDVGVKDEMIKSYYSILEDTMLGFFLEAFQHSFRKRLSKKPKFYFFDPGVVRALNLQLSLQLNEGTFSYGDIFEHFIILQCMQLASYFYKEYRFSYLQTKDGAEVDLVVERPGQKILFIEIKSSHNVQDNHLFNLRLLANDFGECEAVCFSCDDYPKRLDGIAVFPWRQGVQRYFVRE